MASIGYDKHALHELDRWESERTSGRFGRRPQQKRREVARELRLSDRFTESLRHEYSKRLHGRDRRPE